MTNNSKTGWAFSLPRSKTCINATEVCKACCYGKGIRYQSDAAKAKRERNWKTVEFLLQEGGPQLLAENLVMLIDQARPIDWLAAKITGNPTNIPWTIRVHDVGDFFSAQYVLAWQLAAENRPDCSVWFYTRSFVDSKVFEALCQFAALPNCQGWLSIDADNYNAGIMAKCNTAPGLWKLALLQQNESLMPDDLVPALKQHAAKGEVVSFPYHHGGRHAVPIKEEPLMVCPAVTGVYKLHNDRNIAKPCQACTFCLP